MAVVRVKKNGNYTVMSNHHLKEKTMSLKAKGLLSVMLSLPDEWNYTVDGLVSICQERKNTIQSTLKELRDYGYLVIQKILPNQSETGRIEYIYYVYEVPQNRDNVDFSVETKQGGEKYPLVCENAKPQTLENRGNEEQEELKQEVKKQDTEKQALEKQELEKQALEKQELEKQALENQPQLNTNILNTDILNNNILNNNIYNINNNMSIAEEFEHLWKLYPRKLGKSKAFKYYKKARKSGTSFEEIENGIKAYVGEINKNKTESEFVKHGSTWFNNQCWKDEYDFKPRFDEHTKYGGTYL